MKRIISAIAALTVLMTAAGCGRDNSVISEPMTVETNDEVSEDIINKITPATDAPAEEVTERPEPAVKRASTSGSKEDDSSYEMGRNGKFYFYYDKSKEKKDGDTLIFDDIEMYTFCWELLTDCPPEIYAEDEAAQYFTGRTASTEISSLGDFDLCILRTTAAESGLKWQNSYYLLYKGMSFEIFAEYEDSSLSPRIDELAMEVLETAELRKYEFYPPEETTTYEYDCFSVTADPMWSYDKYSAKVKHTYSHNMSEYLSELEIKPISEDNDDLKACAESAHHNYDLDRSVRTCDYVSDLEETEMFGRKCFWFNADHIHGVGVHYDDTRYFFEVGGRLYELAVRVCKKDGYEQVKEDYEKLLEGITIKE